MKTSTVVPIITGSLTCGLLAMSLCAAPARAQDAKPVILGLAAVDADKHNVEFQTYDRMIPVYRQNGIQAALLESSYFYRRDCTEDQLLEKLKRFHVVHLATTEEGVTRFDEKHQRRAPVVGRALARYVEQGGGLFLQPRPVRYPGDEDELYWNAVLAPLGAKILHEGVFDKTRAFEGQTLGKATFWRTSNIQAHPVTRDVSCLALPLHGYGHFPGLVAMEYAPEWQILVRGENKAQSYRSNADNVIDLDAAGTYAQAPPVLAVRSLGKGRIVCYPISPLFAGSNHRNPLWADIVETNGDRAGGQPSQSMKMQMNAYRWLAEPSAGLSGFGTYAAEPYQPVQFPAAVEWDKHRFGQPAAADAGSTGVRGIFGVHSSYSDGSGSVADYAVASKAAGLSFIVFADPLEKLTPEKLDRLKADCAEASQDGSFYACPGIEFTDGFPAARCWTTSSCVGTARTRKTCGGSSTTCRWSTRKTG